jgi:hypothetical protein
MERASFFKRTRLRRLFVQVFAGAALCGALADAGASGAIARLRAADYTLRS